MKEPSINEVCFEKANQDHEPIRQWVCRIVHELIVQQKEWEQFWKPEVVNFT